MPRTLPAYHWQYEHGVTFIGPMRHADLTWRVSRDRRGAPR